MDLGGLHRSLMSCVFLLLLVDFATVLVAFATALPPLCRPFAALLGRLMGSQISIIQILHIQRDFCRLKHRRKKADPKPGPGQNTSKF